MSGQFKKPFQNSEKRSTSDSQVSSIAEQNTIKPPAVSSIAEQSTIKPPAVSPLPTQNFPAGVGGPQGYVQGKHGQYGVRQTHQPFPGAGAFSQTQIGNPPVQTPLALPQTPYPPSLPVSNAGMPLGSTRMPGMGAVIVPPSAPGIPYPAQPPVRPGSAGAGPLSPGRKTTGGTVSSGKQRKKKKRRVPIWARVVIGFLTVLLVLGVGSYWYYQANYAGFVSSVTNQQFTRHPGETDPNAGKTGSVLNWGRVNILLLGSDTDEKPIWGGNSFLAQTIIVVSIDTRTHDVGMLSIPRDYWINIPGYGMDKLDTAFAHGGSINHNMSGVGEVVATLDQDFGIPINFYAWVGLNGFINIINTVGGVDVNVTHPIVDDTYPDDVGTTGAAQNNYKRLYIGDGPQHLDGPTALEYVRSRHSTSDFDRSARQQQVLSALKLKLDNPNIIGELPQIANDLKGSVATGMSPTQVFELMDFARGVNQNAIRHLTLGGSLYTTSGTVNTPYGLEDVVFPRCDTIGPAINSFLHITTGTCNITADVGRSSQIASARPGANQGNTAGATAPAPDMSMNILPAGAASFSDLFGLRDIIDLVAMVVLDSPQV